MSDYTEGLAAELANEFETIRYQQSARLAPNARLEVVDDCGHFPWLEAPGSVRAAIDRAQLAAS